MTVQTDVRELCFVTKKCLFYVISLISYIDELWYIIVLNFLDFINNSISFLLKEGYDIISFLIEFFLIFMAFFILYSAILSTKAHFFGYY